jgi:hypothetical protein
MSTSSTRPTQDDLERAVAIFERLGTEADAQDIRQLAQFVSMLNEPKSQSEPEKKPQVGPLPKGFQLVGRVAYDAAPLGTKAQRPNSPGYVALTKTTEGWQNDYSIRTGFVSANENDSTFYTVIREVL